MSVIANLSVLLSADSTGVAKGVKSAKDSFASLGGGSGGGGLLAGLTGGLSLAADAGMAALDVLADAANYAIDRIGEAFGRLDKIAASSHKLGIAAPELTKLQFAAQQSGVEIGKLDSLLVKFRDATASAAKSGKGDVFKELGLSAKELMALPVDQQFTKVADALANVGNHSDRLRLAVDLFGQQGADALELMEGGAAGLADQFKDLERLNGVLTQQEVEQVASMNDAWSRFGTAVDSVWNHIAAAAAPVLQVVIDMGTEIIATFSKFFEGSIGGWGNLTKWAGTFLDFMVNLGRATIDVGVKVVDMATTASQAFERMLSGGNELIKAWSRGSINFDDHLAGLRAVNAQIKGMASAWKGASDFLPRDLVSKKLAELERAAKATGDKVGQSLAWDSGSAGATDAGGKPPAALEFGTKEAFSAINAGGGDTGTMVDQQKLTVKGIQTQTEILLEQRRELQRVGRWLDGFGVKQIRL